MTDNTLLCGWEFETATYITIIYVVMKKHFSNISCSFEAFVSELLENHLLLVVNVHNQFTF